jgi:hypothetical protein
MAALPPSWSRGASSRFSRLPPKKSGRLHGVLSFPANSTVGPLHLNCMIRKLKSGEFRLYSRKKDAKTGKRKNLGTFSSLAAAKKHERAVQFFKRAR